MNTTESKHSYYPFKSISKVSIYFIVKCVLIVGCISLNGLSMFFELEDSIV